MTSRKGNELVMIRFDRDYIPPGSRDPIYYKGQIRTLARPAAIALALSGYGKCYASDNEPEHGDAR